MNEIVSEDLTIRKSINGDDYSKLDFTEEDGTDPLKVNDFFHTGKAETFQQNKLASIWCVEHKGKLAGCFTLSMFAISTGKLSDAELVGEKAASARSYPAVLLGQMGVDKTYRRRGIGYWACQFCTGLAREIGSKISCRYIVLQTNKNKAGLYEKSSFVKSPKQPDEKGNVWMYKKLYM